MRKLFIALVLFVSLFANNSFADICYDISVNVADNAYNIISNKKEIYKYCSICNDTKAEKIIIKDIKSGSPILVNGKAIDLAHTYYKKDNQFVNIGIASQCISNGEYNITASLKELLPTHKTSEADKSKAKKQTQEAIQTCFNENKNNKEHITTSDMIARNSLYIECIINTIKEELKKVFNKQEYSDIINSLDNMQKNIFSFYSQFYQTNKYCDPSCGSISLVKPYIDEEKILEYILEDVIYLNIKNRE
jgi:hypothetical protein